MGMVALTEANGQYSDGELKRSSGFEQNWWSWRVVNTALEWEIDDGCTGRILGRTM